MGGGQSLDGPEHLLGLLQAAERNEGLGMELPPLGRPRLEDLRPWAQGYGRHERFDGLVGVAPAEGAVGTGRSGVEDAPGISQGQRGFRCHPGVVFGGLRVASGGMDPVSRGVRHAQKPCLVGVGGERHGQVAVGDTVIPSPQPVLDLGQDAEPDDGLPT